jgi:hypothetical protein
LKYAIKTGIRIIKNEASKINFSEAGLYPVLTFWYFTKIERIPDPSTPFAPQTCGVVPLIQQDSEDAILPNPVFKLDLS